MGLQRVEGTGWLASVSMAAPAGSFTLFHYILSTKMPSLTVLNLISVIWFLPSKHRQIMGLSRQHKCAYTHVHTHTMNTLIHNIHTDTTRHIHTHTHHKHIPLTHTACPQPSHHQTATIPLQKYYYRSP